jgi:DNA-binding MarR family transcriptional regulator
MSSKNTKAANRVAQPSDPTATLATGRLPGHLIRRLHQVSVATFMQETKGWGHNITPVQHAALIAIRQFPGLDQAGLSDITACDRVTAGGVVKRLEEKEFIRRTYVDGDQRSKRLFILPKGQQLLDNLQPHIEKVQLLLLDSLTNVERLMFVELLSKIVAATNDAGRSSADSAADPDLGG